MSSKNTESIPWHEFFPRKLDLPSPPIFNNVVPFRQSRFKLNHASKAQVRNLANTSEKVDGKLILFTIILTLILLFSLPSSAS